MHYRKVSTALMASVVTAFSLVSADAFACGESLFRVGKGVSYRDHTAPLPGNMLVVATTDAHRAFADRLAAAGHRVQVVEDAAQLAEAMGSDDYDVVLAAFSDRETVEAQFASVTSAATYLPVTMTESEEASAKAMYDRSLAESDSFRKYLKAIHRTLKEAA